jgi:hypothetical protein
MLNATGITRSFLDPEGGRSEIPAVVSGHDASNLGGGHITYATDSSQSEALTFVSPSIPRSSLVTVPAGGQATFPWADTPNDDLTFEMILEPTGFPVPPGTTEDPLLIDIHGFIQHFDFTR